MVRNKELKLRLGREEIDKLQKKADSLGLKLTQYIRLVSLKAQVVTIEEKN